MAVTILVGVSLIWQLFTFFFFLTMVAHFFFFSFIWRLSEYLFILLLTFFLILLVDFCYVIRALVVSHLPSIKNFSNLPLNILLLLHQSVSEVSGGTRNCVSARKPSKPLSFLPFALAKGASSNVYFDSLSMLLISIPLADVLGLAPVSLCAEAVLKPLNKLALVSLVLIVPYFSADTVHVGISELTRVGHVTVSKEVGSLAFKHAVYEVSVVVAAIGPLKMSVTILFGALKLTYVGGTVCPGLFAVAILLIVHPIPLVPVASRVREHSVPICAVISPLALVDISS